MKKIFTLAVVLGAWCPIQPCLAIDPPPAEILRAPIEQQRQYVRKIGIESERSRTKVAKQRYEEKQEYRRAMASEMDRQLNLQREIMIAQSRPVDESGSEAGGLSKAIGGGLASRLWTFALLAFSGLMIYRFRDNLFQWGQRGT